MGPPKLYMTEISPCVRAVLLTARLLDITLELREVDLKNKEHLSNKFLQLNPQHTVPTLEDCGLVIWDSHAICAYLVGKYGKDDSLYPKDLHKRAIIDQRLHFDCSILQCLNKSILYPIIYEDQVEFHIGKIQEHCIHETYGLLETFLDSNDWIAGDSVTIADLSLLPSTTSLDVVTPIDSKKFPKLSGWIRRAERHPFYVANENGLNKLKMLVTHK